MMIDNGEDEAERGSEFFEMMEDKAELSALLRNPPQLHGIALMKSRYATAKAAKTGERVACPCCPNHFKKRSYQQAFCSNKGAGNCKDFYWNVTVPGRLERANEYLA